MRVERLEANGDIDTYSQYVLDLACPLDGQWALSCVIDSVNGIFSTYLSTVCLQMISSFHDFNTTYATIDSTCIILYFRFIAKTNIVD